MGYFVPGHCKRKTPESQQTLQPDNKRKTINHLSACNLSVKKREQDTLCRTANRERKTLESSCKPAPESWMSVTQINAPHATRCKRKTPQSQQIIQPDGKRKMSGCAAQAHGICLPFICVYWKEVPDIWRTAGKDSGSKAFFSWKGARFTGYFKRQQVFSEETLTALLFPHLFCESGETVTIKYSVCTL